MNYRCSSSRNGFSLIEVIAAIAVVGVLSWIVVASQTSTTTGTVSTKLDSDVATVNQAIAIYLANGGSLAEITDPQAVLDKMKTRRTADADEKTAGFSGSMVDPRLAVRMTTATETASAMKRAVWNTSTLRFYVATTGAGVTEFLLDDAKGTQNYGTEARSTFGLAYEPQSGWIWPYRDSQTQPRSTPTLVATNSDGGSGNPVNPPPNPWPAPTRFQLRPPTFTQPGGFYNLSSYDITLGLVDPNTSSSSWIMYSVDGGNYVRYSGPFPVDPNTRVTAFVTGDSYLYYSSAVIDGLYLANPPKELTAPVITLSREQFLWDTAETVLVSLENPNPAKAASLEFRVDGGDWRTYDAPFELAAQDHESGAAITARALPLSVDYLISAETSAFVEGPPPPTHLIAPEISTSAPNFMAGTADVITVTIRDPNPARSELQYRLEGEDWQRYTAAFSVKRSDYPTGLVVEARAHTTSRAYLDSVESGTAIGLTPVQLQTPSVNLTAPNFMAGSVETIAITITNPNAEGSELEYCLADGDWQTYTGAIRVTREAYATGLSVEARARTTDQAYLTSDLTSSTIGLTPVQLRTPSIACSAANFVAGSVDSVSVTLTNPNDAGSALDYRLDSGTWQTYSGAFSVTRAAYATGLAIEARARATAPAYLNSDSASSSIGLTPVKLQTPSISTSAANFVAGSVETIAITLSNLNSEGSALDYRLNGGSWTAYSAAFNVTRALYPTGVTIEARARSTAPAYLNSETTSSSVGLTAVQLQAPTISRSALNFIAGSVESVTVTLSNPNGAGSALDYRLNSGSWIAYSSAFAVTRTTYPAGVTIEARARSTAPAYLNSDTSSSSVGLSTVQLQTPTISRSALNFIAGSVESVTVTLSNPNGAGSALDYRLAGGSWIAYSSAFTVTRATYPTGVTIEARARATSSAYSNSATASASVGLNSVQLQKPVITPSASNFMAGSAETISVTLTNPNLTGSALDYRLAGGSWIAYSSAFNVTRAPYPSGLTIEARARATNAAYADSSTASATLGLTPVTLQAPVINKSASNFMAGSVESISITLTNPNAAGSALDYRLSGGSWTAYSSAVSVTRASYASGLTVEARARATDAAYTDSTTATATVGLTPVSLQVPVINKSASNFMAGSVESISVTLTNPNAAGSALDYRLNGGSWIAYSTAFNVTRATYASGLTVEARARATNAAYTDSTTATTTIGLTPAQLQVPTITPSAPNFAAGVVDSISVTLTNPNSSGSALDYRLNGGAWVAYSSAFNVTRASYASGLTIEARARATSAAYTTSNLASVTIGLTAVQLRAPTISTSASNFVPGSVESITVTLTNPNSTGSALDYRINGGSWVAYSSAFSVTRATYASGLTVDARARATNAAYSNSDNATVTIGLTQIKLNAPTIRLSAPNFVSSQVESISVTITNTNNTGSTLEYRINAGTWKSYSSAFNVTRATYPSGLTIEARAKATSAAYADSDSASVTIGVKTNVQKLTVTFTSLSSSAGYLNEAYAYVNGDAYYLGNSDMGAGNTVTVNVYVDPLVTTVFDLSIDTFIRSGSKIVSGALRGMDTRAGSQFTVIGSNSSFSGKCATAAKLKDVSNNSKVDLTVGYEDLIITGGSPDYDYNDFLFEFVAPKSFSISFGGYMRN